MKKLPFIVTVTFIFLIFSTVRAENFVQPMQMPVSGIKSVDSNFYIGLSGLFNLFDLDQQTAQVASPSVDLNAGLVGYWNMDSTDIDWSTNTIVDHSGKGSKGNLVGLALATSSALGKINQALKFESAGTYIDIPYSQVLNPSITNAVTYAAWVKFDQAPTNWVPIFTTKNAQNGLNIYKNGLLLFRPGGTVPQLVAYVSPTVPSNTVGQWFHIATTYDGAKEAIYLNGALACSKCLVDATGTAGNSSTLQIAGGGGGIDFIGNIDDARVYNRALSPEEIFALSQKTSFESVPLVPPATPHGLASTVQTENSISLSWNANTESDLLNYKLYKNNVLLTVLDSNVTSYEAVGLTPGTSYSFSILSVNKSNLESPKSPNISVSTQGAPIVVQTAPKYVNSIEVKGTLVPDATGVYDLSATNYNSLPVWTRKDGAFSVWAENGAFWRLSVAPGKTTAGVWKFDYKTPGQTDAESTSFVGYAGIVRITNYDNKFPTPAQYIASLPAPSFKSGNTLPPLTRWGWGLSYESNVELARWGYTVELGDADPATVAKVDDPNSEISKKIALAKSNPSLYKMSINIPRVPVAQIPETAYAVDASGSRTKTWSPEAPSGVLSGMASYISTNLQKVTSKVPVAVILNGGERYLGVCGFECAKWKNDPAIIAAKGSASWPDYIAERKAYQEMYFTNAVKSLTNAIYVFYPTGNEGRIDLNRDWLAWDWDYKWMNKVADYPGASMYWGQFNSGWTGHLKRSDMLSYVLNAHGYDTTFGKPLSYNWVCAGWSATESGGWGDIERYYGFLKSYYTAGMIGGIAGYFSYPTGGFNATFDSNSPPHWLLQIMTLGRVHAEFSYLEDILRNGDLLPGPYMNESIRDQPAYEFRTGYADTRVLVRKMRGQKRWLISAWAADNVARKVDVDIPGIGTVSVQAHPSGSLYDARIVSGSLSLTQIDNGSMNPGSLNLPTAQPDVDNSAPYVPPPIVNSTSGSCSTTLNSCGLGTFKDIADSTVANLWQCIGANGGSNATCSLSKTVDQNNTVQTLPTPTPTAAPAVVTQQPVVAPAVVTANQNTAVTPVNNALILNNAATSRSPMKVITEKIYSTDPSYLKTTSAIPRVGKIADNSLVFKMTTTTIDVTLPRVPSWIEFIRDLFIEISRRIKMGAQKTVTEIRLMIQ